MPEGKVLAMTAPRVSLAVASVIAVVTFALGVCLPLAFPIQAGAHRYQAPACPPPNCEPLCPPPVSKR